MRLYDTVTDTIIEYDNELRDLVNDLADASGDTAATWLAPSDVRRALGLVPVVEHDDGTWSIQAADGLWRTWRPATSRVIRSGDFAIGDDLTQRSVQ